MGKVYAVILASGYGERAGYDLPKQFINIAGRTIVEHSIHAFEKSGKVDEIIIVTHPSYRNLMEEIVKKSGCRKVCKIVNGGRTRRESSAIGVNAIDDDDAYVLLHDAARPFVTGRIIEDCVLAVKKYGAAAVAVPSTDTVLRVSDERFVEEIPPRGRMMRAQTPQCFRAALIKKAHEIASRENENEVTDDCGLIVKYRLGEVFVVNGDERNIKITYPEDIYLAERIHEIINGKV